MTRNLRINILIFFLLFLICAPLRFINLGYSEFQDDEKKVRIILANGETVKDFLMVQRKGPMQFLIAQIPYLITRDLVNETAYRLPFTLFNLASIFEIYILIYLFTKNKVASFITALLFSLNGFIVAFGRIAQYQSLNMFFSLGSIIFFYLLTIKSNKLYLLATLGGIFTSLSFLAHWDAIYYLPVVFIFIIFFLKRRDLTIKKKILILLVGTFGFLILFLPFIVPYIINLTTVHADNIVYLNKRLGLEGSSFKEHIFIFQLYNPFITIYFLLAGVSLSLLFFKKTYVFLVWFLLDLLAIKYLMVTPKTHIYNYIIPMIICSGLGYYFTISSLFSRSKKFFYLLSTLFLLFISFLFYQSYMLFIDNKPEYPWFQKKVLWFETKPFYSDQVITFGFPYYRAWKKVNELIPRECTYLTNETKSISQIYINAKYGKNDDCFYYIRIKYPFYLDGADVAYPGLISRKKVFTFRNNDRDVTQVYKLK